jgi:signal transduction histidine kinase/ActR/RegA family two-component response regulator
MNLLRRYWPDASVGDRMTVAVSRALSVFAVMAGAAGVAVMLVNIHGWADFPIFTSVQALASAIALLAPLVIIGSKNFLFRARVLGYFNIMLLTGLAISHGEVASAAHVLMLPTVMTFTLVLGARDGLIAAAITLMSVCVTYVMALGAAPGSTGLHTYFAGMVSCTIFAYVASAVVRTEMTAMLRDANDQRDRAQKAGDAKSRFLASMSHEIRTPLNGVLGMAELLERSDLSPDQRKQLNVIRQSGAHLLATLNDILDLSRIEAGRLSIDQRPFSVNELMAQVGRLHSVQAEAKGLHLICDVNPNMKDSDCWLGDPTRLQQIAHNLVSNAIKFTKTGTVTFTISEAHQGEGLVLRVADTGCGMSDAEVARVFKPFTQADESAVRSYQGAGLGLAIVHRLVTLMDGEVSLDSTPGQGTVFTVKLPLPKAHLNAPSKRSEPSEATVLGPAWRVMVVDDNESNRMVAAGFLEALDVEVTVASDGDEAVELAATAHFDLILMDIQMPRMSGVDALAAMREIGHTPPVIAMTADAMTHQLAHYANCGFTAVLPKPLNHQDVLTAIERIMGPAPQNLAPDRTETGVGVTTLHGVSANVH